MPPRTAVSRQTQSQSQTQTQRSARSEVRPARPPPKQKQPPVKRKNAPKGSQQAPAKKRRQSRCARQLQILSEEEEEQSDGQEEEGYEDEAPPEDNGQQQPQPFEDEMGRRGYVSLSAYFSGNLTLQVHICAVYSPDLTPNSGTEPTDPYKCVVQHIMRAIHMNISFVTVVYVSNRIQKKKFVDLESRKKLTEEEHICEPVRTRKEGGEIFAARLPEYEEDIEDLATNRHLRDFGHALDQAAGVARGWDLGGLKIRGAVYVNRICGPWLKENFPGQEGIDLEEEKAYGRGPRHPLTLVLIAPPRLCKDIVKDYNSIRNKVISGKLPLTGEEFPMFLYRDMDYDPDDPEYQLCISELLFTFWRHLFTAPSSTKAQIPGEASKKPVGQVALNKRTEVPPGSICYTTIVVWWTICELMNWKHTNGFDRDKFYDSLLDLFSDVDDPWVKDTLARWNHYCYLSNHILNK
ncbi:hypothetical protein FA13DRAFT_1805921 [Coprinellus micaceus]|uniref:Uncharacterized protein n=1 Tax=Coprinellus micaceus TaxID=71717 RepID=A0A4Y7RUI4_COPMI|nr:hypothetical protein FA13DRAFT_1805921 [Coprinellus micaceus]